MILSLSLDEDVLDHAPAPSLKKRKLVHPPHTQHTTHNTHNTHTHAQHTQHVHTFKFTQSHIHTYVSGVSV